MSAIEALAPPALMTAEEFWDWCCRPESEDSHYELDAGRVVSMPPPGELHGMICLWVAHVLMSYVVRRGQGDVLTNDSGLIVSRNPDTVRGPDIMVFLDSRSLREARRGYTDRTPALAVEVFSPSDRPTRLVRRVRQLHTRGVPLVWVVYPEEMTVEIYRPGQFPDELTATDTLGGFDALPGFECRVADLFNLPGRPPVA